MIEPPTNCPSCDSTLEWSNDLLYCRNTNCSAKSFKQVEHFAKTLKIKGLGPSSIEKLNISNINEIYEISLDYIEVMLKSEKLSIKLFEEIERSKTEQLNTVLPAFGIPLIGKTATDKLTKVCNSIFDINVESCKKAGLGPKATENLINWLDNEFAKYCDLPFNFEFSNNGIKISEIKDVVCISGKLKSYSNKAAATEVLLSKGYIVKDSLTKDVTILVNESGIESAKTLKARNSGVKIVTNLKELMENI